MEFLYFLLICFASFLGISTHNVILPSLICLDTDMTRRLVAKELDASSTAISKIATLNPTCVSMEDSAMDALTAMVSNGFRHLPVTDNNKGVVGVLDIAKCLNDAISKLEKSQDKSSTAAQGALMEVVASQGGNGSQVAALQTLLAPLMEKAFGDKTSPSLRSLLTGKPTTIVSPQTSVLEAGMKMSESKKAALVVDNGELVGIFSFKDCLSRCVAKELPLDETQVSSVMTPHPITLFPESNILEALQFMHENGVLTLPVVEENGSVAGVITILDVIYGAGGAEGWRSIFSSALDMDEYSDDASFISGKGSTVAGSTVRENRSKAPSIKKQENIRPVSKLRPKKPLVSSSNDTVLAVSKMLAAKRGSASLVVDEEGQLAGIVTETDITRRMVAKHMDASLTTVSDIATPNPAFCSMEDSAMEALATMVSNSFRHLPVTDEKGSVVGLLDIAKCLSDAIKKLEKAQSKSSSAVQEALMEVVASQGVQDTNAAATLHAVLGPLMSKAFGNSTSPSLGSLLKGQPSTIVCPETTVLEAGMKMAESKKAALVVEEGKLVGIFTFKDMVRPEN